VEPAAAKSLIANAPYRDHAQHWLDLGCGDGVFTRALAELLPNGSRIEAWDRDRTALSRIPNSHAGVEIHTRVMDFLGNEIPHGVQGILIANALHYVADHQPFLKRLWTALDPDGLLLIVEYDTDIPVPEWVPYPISERKLVALLRTTSHGIPTEIGRRPSIFGSGDLYAAFAERSASSDRE
jgi:trans-aconitate methyltransferase